MAPVTAVEAVTVSSDDPQTYEDEHVHSIYDEIAPHFSSTRYKPWPVISQFLSSIPAGWVGLDSGTGNGKYLPLPLDRPGSVWTIGLDRSRSLLEFARTAAGTTREVVWGDVLAKPWRDGVFDYAISIATIHHLSTPARRKQAVQRLIQSISPSHGRALIYVWAIQQDELSKRTIPFTESGDASSAHSKGQDVFVPWVLSSQMRSQPDTKAKSLSPGQGPASPQNDAASTEMEGDTSPRVFNRYYHMFAKGELRALVQEAAEELGLGITCGSRMETGEVKRGIEIVQDGWERSNYFIEFRCWQSS